MFELNTARSTLSIHAITSSLLSQLKKDTFQKQLELLFTSNALNNNILDHCTNNELLKLYILNTLIFIFAWWGYEIYNSPNSPLCKLNKFTDYKEKQKVIKIFILTIIFIFFRNVENAI